MITGLDHVNLRTPQLEAMVAWYEKVLGLRTGPRPAFAFDGAWLYAGDRAVVHLVETGAVDAPEGAHLALEHFALRGTGYATFLRRLDDLAIPYRLSHVPPGPVDIVQVNIHDPDGTHIHVDFTGADVAG